jgi:hypothetical protein
MGRSGWLAVLILLIAAAFRLNALTYGLTDVCLTVSEEEWLYEPYQPTSLYTWNFAPPSALNTLPGRVQPTPLVTAETAMLDRFFVRLVSVAAGLLALAMLMRLGRSMQARWWWLAGLLVAVAPWFVTTDRWTVRFDTAPFAIACSLLALWKMNRLPARWQRDLAIAVHTVAALSLWVIAPPLWWLSIGLLLLQPSPRWRWMAFVFLVGVVLIPGLQTPELWLAAARRWDVSATAACIIALVSLALWWRRSLPRVQEGILLILILIVGGITLYQDSQLKNPNSDEWQLIHWLQSRVPDDSVVRFDSATWPLASIVACPVGANIHFTAQSMVVQFFDVRNLPNPYYFVSAEPESVAEMPYVNTVADQYWIGRDLALNQPVDVNFGDLVHLLSYEVLTPTVDPSGVIDIRIDYQFGSNITPDVLSYAAFVHVTPFDDPGAKWANFTDPFFEESGNTGSRRVMLNHHIRFSLPSTIPRGRYAVRYGIFNLYTGELAGDTLVLGEIQVQ